MFSKELKEECGVFGVWGVPHAAEVTYYGLHSLQHRGQEGCGIVSVNDNGELHRVKGLGLVTEVFNSENLGSLHGNMAVGHVRYSTHGGGGIENVQPFLFRHNSGDFALVHNGNVVNSAQLRKYLEDRGSLFQSTSDSEILAHLIKKEPVERNSPRIIPIMEALNMIEGAFAFMVMTNHRIYAMRDKYGLRPLSIGRIGDGYVLSSETCAFSVVGAEFVRDVEPGEIVTITKDGIRSDKSMCLPDSKKQARCVFEYIYFARPDSVFDGVSVYHSRIHAGRCLAIDSPVNADLVVGVPESGNAAALGYSMQSGIPYGTAFVKNSYVGRTFIKPKQSSRVSAVKVKLNVLKEAVAGKRVIMIDDSIVRGTTSHLIVKMLRDAGAKEVHVKVSAPPFLHPCYFGTDIPSEDQLIASGRTVEEIRQIIGADSLSYLKMERLPELAEGLPICTACFSGNYPLEPPKEDIRGEYTK